MRARRQTLRPRCRGGNRWLGYGPHVTDAVSGLPIPKKIAVKQRGGYVDRRWSEGSRDKPDSYSR